MSQLRSRIYKDGVLVNGGGGGAGSDTTAIHDDTANEINAITAKATPVAADVAIIEDSADSWNKKKIALTSLLGGGGGASPFDATFGTGGDYPNAGGAVTAGKSSLLQVGHSTETSDIAIPSNGLSIFQSPAVNMNMGVYNFTRAGDYPFSIAASDCSATITLAKTSSDVMIPGANYTTCLEDVHFVNNSTVANARIINTKVFGSNIQIDLPNITNGGFDLRPGSVIQGLILTGGGTSSTLAIRMSNTSTIDGVTFSGSWPTASLATAVITMIGGRSCSMSNIVSNATSGKILFEVGDGATVQGGGCNTTCQFDFKLVSSTTRGCKVADLYTNQGTIDVENTVNFVLSDIWDLATLDMSDSNASSGKITNVRVTNAVTFNGNRNKISNAEFLGGAQDNGSDNGHSNNQYGPDAGGGVLTLTLGAAAVRPRVGMCMTDAAIIDLGSTTPAISPNTNTVY